MMMLSIKERFVWNRHKNERNKRLHRVSFETASTVYDDPFYLEVYDEDNSIVEDRFNVTGTVTGLVNGRFITVTVTYRDLIRIISARESAPEAIRSYHEILSAITGGEDAY
jgi:uncharacterized DUF497 family protein